MLKFVYDIVSSDQSVKHFTIVNNDSRVVVTRKMLTSCLFLDGKLFIILTIGSM